MPRLEREKEAIEKATSLDQAWESAKSVDVTTAVSCTRDLQNILPEPGVENVIDSSSLTSPPLAHTHYEKVSDTIPIVQSATVQGKDVTYYSTEQSNQNLLLKASVAENEELITTMHELQQEQVANSRELLNKRAATRQQRLREFDEGYRWPEPSGLTAAHLVENMSLKVDMDQFAGFGDVIHPSTVPITSFVHDCIQEKLTNSKKQCTEAAVNSTLSAYLHENPAQKVDSKHVLWDMLVRHADLVHTDVLQYIKGELAVSGEKLKTLLAECDRLEIEQEEFTHRDDIASADVAHKSSVSTLEKIITIVRSRLSQISMGSSDTGTFQGKYLQNTNQSRSMLSDFRNEKEDLRTNLLADLQSLTKFGEDASKTNADLLKNYDSSQQKSNSYLTRLTREQDDLWQQVEGMVAEIRSIGDRKSSALTEHLIATECEEKRKREYVEFSEVFAEHSRRVQSMVKNTDTALMVLDSADDFINKGCSIIDAKDVAEEQGDIKLAELNRYLSVFRKYCLKIGDLIVKRKARLSGIQRLRRNAESQLALCSETLDPNKNKYKAEIAQLNVQELEVKENITDLLHRLAQQEADFQPSEELLEELGVEFTPPKLEHKEMEAGKRKLLLKITKDIVGKEQEEVDREATDLRKLHTDTSLGKEVVERKRETKKKGTQMTMTGSISSGLASPPLPAAKEEDHTMEPLQQEASDVKVEQQQQEQEEEEPVAVAPEVVEADAQEAQDADQKS